MSRNIGVVVVPRDIDHDVLVRAEEITADQERVFLRVAEDKTVNEIPEKGVYFWSCPM